MKEINKNFIYNAIYQLFIFVIPFLITPYISRVLGANNIGIYSYTYSIVYYFMLFAMIGINNHGIRTISKNRQDIKELSKTFFSIFNLQVILSLSMIIIYLIFIFLYRTEYHYIQILQGINLLSVLFDINWFFFGIEKFKITISRNFIIKVISIVMIYIFVKSQEDLWIYVLIMSLSLLISQMYLWLFIRKFVVFTKVQLKDSLAHLKQCLILFIPVIAYGIYRVMDKTMIGYFSNTLELGFYENSEKIINIPISFIMAMGTVMLPHMSKFSDKELKNKIIDSFQLNFFVLVPMTIGLFVISHDFIPVFLGDEFDKSIYIVMLLSPTVIFSSVAMVIRTNYLIPQQKNSIYVKSTIYGAILNLIMNLIFITKYGAIGACIGTITSEFFVMFYQIVCTREIIDYKHVFKLFIKSFILSLIMALSILLVGILLENVILKLVVQLLLGITIYLLLNYKYFIYNFMGKKF